MDDQDRRVFMLIIMNIKECIPFELYSYCLMSNHFHLLIRVGNRPLPIIMQLVLTRYATYWNKRHHRTGHLFQSRYKAIHCDRDSYLMELLRYIHLNPVRGGMVPEPQLWPWSAHGAYIAPTKEGLVSTEFPLSLFHWDPARARALYEAFLIQGLQAPDSAPHPPSPSLEAAPLDAQDLRALPTREACLGETLQEVGESVARETGLSLDEIRGASRVKPLAEARKALIRRAATRGFRASEIAVFLNRSRSLVSKQSGLPRQFPLFNV